MEFFKIRRAIPFMRHAKVFNIISLVTFVLAVVFLATKGLHLSIEFTGGAVMEVSSQQALDSEKVRSSLNRLGIAGDVTNFGTSRDVLIRLPLKKQEGVSQNQEMQKQADAVMAEIRAADKTAELKRVEFVGGQVGGELATDGALALLFVVMTIFGIGEPGKLIAQGLIILLAAIFYGVTTAKAN